MTTSVPGDWADPRAGQSFISPQRVVEHDWLEDGTTGFTRTVMTQDGTNGLTLTVESGFGVFTATGTGDGQHEAWRIANTHWADSELTSYLGRSDELAAPPDAAQWWHLHRVTQDNNGLWHAFAVWTDIIFLVPPILNLACITFDGASDLDLNGVNGNDFGNMLRTLPILRAQRTSNVSTYWTTVPWINALAVGHTGAVTGMANTGFNQTTTAITAIDLTRRTFSLANTGSNATDADAGGIFSPAANPPLNALPMMLSSRLIGNTVYAKQWHPEEPEPDWSDFRRVFTHTVTTGTPAPHSGPGYCAIGAAHMQSGNKARFGAVTAKRIN